MVIYGGGVYYFAGQPRPPILEFFNLTTGEWIYNNDTFYVEDPNPTVGDSRYSPSIVYSKATKSIILIGGMLKCIEKGK
jgi:hypothetical protein